MKIIVVVDKNWAIGKNNDLLFSLKEDMRHFKEQTLNKVVVMGENTLKSLPNSKPLKNRLNVVLSKEKYDDCVCFSSLEPLFEYLRQFEPNDVFVIGGASVYKTLLPFCDEAIVTKVDCVGEGATHFFPNLDENNSFECVEEGCPIEDGQYKIRFCVYKKVLKGV